MSRTFYTVYNSPDDMFKRGRAVTYESIPSMFVRSRETIATCDRADEGSFNGSWTKLLRTFDAGVFKSRASLTDDIISEIRTTDFTEMKWKFRQRLDEGDAVDVERYIAGEEKCWSGCRRLPKVKRAVRIYVNFGGNCNRSAKELAVAGACGVTIAECMESIGVAAEIWGVHFNRGMDSMGNDYVDLVRLKAQSEYADVGLINFMLGDDSVFRNLMFRLWCKVAADNGKDTDYGLGQSRQATLVNIGLTPSERKTAILVPQLFDIEDAKEWLARALSNQEILQEAAI